MIIINIVKHRQREFSLNIPSDMLAGHCKRLEVVYWLCVNVFCKYLWTFLSMHILLV